MGLFRRSAPANAWERMPFQSNDPDIVYQFGITSVQRSDGIGMMSAGWTLLGLVGIAEKQSFDFLSDGFKAWRDAGAPVEEQFAFLTALFDRLADPRPVVRPTDDPWALPPHVGQPASIAYGARAWTASELIRMAASVTPSLEDRIFVALSETHSAFLPPRTIQDLDALRRSRGMSD